MTASSRTTVFSSDRARTLRRLLQLQILWIVALSTPQVVQAAGTSTATSTDSLYCNNGGFAGENKYFGIARLRDDTSAWFLDDLDGCPRNDVKCRRDPVLHQRRLITGRRHGPYVCAFQRTADGDTAGWVRSDRLDRLPMDRLPEQKAWLGHWLEPDGSDDTLTITPDGRSLAVSGHAYWPNADPPLDRYPWGPNLGQVAGRAVPHGNRLSIGKASDCLVVMHLVADTLVVHDNGACGGMNVRFDGVYVRSRRQQP